MTGWAATAYHRQGVGYRGMVIGDVELRPLGPDYFGEEGSRTTAAWVPGSSGMWLFLGGAGFWGYMSLTPSWHGMLRWKARFQARNGSNVEGLYFFSCVFSNSSQLQPRQAKQSQDFQTRSPISLIITRLASSFFGFQAQGPQLLDILQNFSFSNLTLDQPRVEAV